MSDELFRYTSGTRTPRIIVIGEAWGHEEEKAGLPFVGSSGHLLKQMLSSSGINLEHVLFTNVVDARPPGNDFSAFLDLNKSATPALYGIRPLPVVRAGLEKLNKLIEHCKPLLVIGCGNLPLWALTGLTSAVTVKGKKLPGGITKWRGSQLHTTSGIPFLPIIHPAAILREYSWKFVTQHDLTARAAKFIYGTFGWTRKHKTVAIWQPSFIETVGKLEQWLHDLNTEELVLSVDIETHLRKYIACVGIADDQCELCIPFFYYKTDRLEDYFTAEQEQTVILLLRKLLMHPKLKIVGQNFMYDHQFMSRMWGFKAPVTYDTMLMHHLLWPGTPKGLDYLASLYCSHYVYWKDESQDWDGAGGHENLWKYNCKDVRETYDIHLELKQLIARSGLEKQYEFQLEQWHLASKMMHKGVRVNKQFFVEAREKVATQAYELEEWLSNVMPPDLRFTSTGGHWFASPIFSMQIFYDILGLPPVLHKKTKRPTFNYEAFDTLRKRAPWFAPIFDRLEDYRSLGVYNSHFLSIKLSPAERLTCNFNIGGTETFRWSSSANAFGEGTNFQNIPKGDE